MKSILILFISFFLFQSGIKAHDKIVFKTKESFNRACEKGKFCSSFDLVALESKSDLSNTEEFIQNNSSVLKWSIQNTLVELEILSDQPQKVYYQKFFYTMGLHEIEILEGEGKGVYLVEDFLNLYDF